MDKDLDRSEWDFSKCLNEELNNCINWEYLRQIIRADPEVATRIWHRFLPVELHCPGAIHKRVAGAEDPDFETDQELSKYFPKTPYLMLPPEYRKRLSNKRHSAIGYAIDEHILEVKPHELMPHKWTGMVTDRLDVLSLGIDWSLTDTAIISSFRTIIRARRGKMPPRDPKGTAPHKLMRDRLTGLGALRVYRHWSGNYGEIKHSNAKRLYKTRQAWIKAAGQAADAVRRFREELENRF